MVSPRLPDHPTIYTLLTFRVSTKTHFSLAGTKLTTPLACDIIFIVFAFFFGFDVMAFFGLAFISFIGFAFIGFTFSVLLKAFWRRAERLMDAICLASGALEYGIALEWC